MSCAFFVDYNFYIQLIVFEESDRFCTRFI